MNTLAYLVLLAPAALAGLVNPLQERAPSCEAPLVACGSGCIGPLDVCCPAAPNGEIIGCQGTDNCWIKPDNSPACCPLFHQCPGQKAGSGMFPTLTMPSVTVPMPTVTSVIPPPSVSSPPIDRTTTVASSTMSSISTVKSVTTPSSVHHSSTKPCKTSTPYVSASSSAPASGSTSGSGSDSGSGSVSASPSPLFNGAASTGPISVGGIVAAMVVGFFL